MRNVSKYTSQSVFILFIFLNLTIKAQNKTSVDRIIAKIDNYIILTSDLEKAYLAYISQGERGTPDLKCKVLENLVVNKMLVAKAEIDSIYVEDADVRREVSSRVNAQIASIGSVQELEQYYGKSMEQIEGELFDDIKEQLIVQKMQRELSADLKVTPSEVKRFFNAIPRDSLPYFSTEVSVAQLVLEPKAGKKQEDKTLQLMYELRGRILKGESFEQLARVFSEDPGSAAKGGQLPFYKRGELAPEFEAAAMTLKPGELSMPIKTQFGYHLIELQERRGSTFLTRHILISPKPSLDDIAFTERKLDSIRSLILLDSINFREAAKKFSDDKQTATTGGFFTDADGNVRVSVESLDPNIFFTVDTLKVGTITKPLRFTNYDGSQAFRILYYESKVPPHQANLKDDYQKIAGASLNEKRARILNEWFMEVREDIFIEIDPEYKDCNITSN